LPQNKPVAEHSKRLLIVYHSMTGGTEQMAHAAASGAREAGEIEVIIKPAPDAKPQDVTAADGFIFATPENLAAISGMLKDFFDRTYYAALERLNGRPYAILICAGSDGRNAGQQIERIATGWRLKAIAEPLIVCTGATTPVQILQRKIISAVALSHCRELGKTIASGMALGIF
jgi:multimeric flavodoxin WrbA